VGWLVTDRTDPAVDPDLLRDAGVAIATYLHREYGTRADIDLTTSIEELGVDSIELVEMIVTLLSAAGDNDVDLDDAGEVAMDRVGDLAAVLVSQGWRPAA
jgi:acyl carrier protein